MRTIELTTNTNRKIKATWSLEVEKDFRALYNVEARDIVFNLLLHDLEFGESLVSVSRETEEVNWMKEGF